MIAQEGNGVSNDKKEKGFINEVVHLLNAFYIGQVLYAQPHHKFWNFIWSSHTPLEIPGPDFIH